VILGVLTSAAGLGLLGGSVLISIWGGPKKKMSGIFVAEFVVAAALLLLGSTTNLFVLGAGAFIAFLGQPIVATCSQTIWQKKTAPDIQGRVFAFRRVIAWSTIPIAYAVAGPLADKVFTPLLLEGGALAGSLGRVIGTGPGRGLGLFYIILGVLAFLVSSIGYSYLPLRNVEDHLPDMLPEMQPQEIS
jgi:hypothetical protein